AAIAAYCSSLLLQTTTLIGRRRDDGSEATGASTVGVSGIRFSNAWSAGASVGSASYAATHRSLASRYCPLARTAKTSSLHMPVVRGADRNKVAKRPNAA